MADQIRIFKKNTKPEFWEVKFIFHKKFGWSLTYLRHLWKKVWKPVFKVKTLQNSSFVGNKTHFS